MFPCIQTVPLQRYHCSNGRFLLRCDGARDETSEDAQYLMKVGRLIHKLDAIQMGSMYVKEKVLFLSENVVFKDHERVDKCYSEQEGCLVPICLDAKDFSPCKVCTKLQSIIFCFSVLFSVFS